MCHAEREISYLPNFSRDNRWSPEVIPIPFQVEILVSYNQTFPFELSQVQECYSLIFLPIQRIFSKINDEMDR